MNHKAILSVSVLLLVAFVLSGCNQTVHGGGQVYLLGGYNGSESLQPGTATFALTTMCSDRKDAIMTTLVWNDQTNGVQFTARLPWTPITELFSGAPFTTCDEMAAFLESRTGFFDGSAAMAYINAQGQEVGMVNIEYLS